MVPYRMIETRVMLQPRRDFELRHLQGRHLILSELARKELDLPWNIYLETIKTVIGRERVRTLSVPDRINCVEMHRGMGHSGARLAIRGQPTSAPRGNTFADITQRRSSPIENRESFYSIIDKCDTPSSDVEVKVGHVSRSFQYTDYYSSQPPPFV